MGDGGGGHTRRPSRRTNIKGIFAYDMVEEKAFGEVEGVAEDLVAGFDEGGGEAGEREWHLWWGILLGGYAWRRGWCRGGGGWGCVRCRRCGN